MGKPQDENHSSHTSFPSRVPRTSGIVEASVAESNRSRLDGKTGFQFVSYGGFLMIGAPPNGWFEDLGVPWGTPVWRNLHINQ